MALRFSFRSYRRALRAPLRTAHGRWTEREGLLLRTESEDGPVRYGEVAPIAWFGTETIEEAREVCAKLGDRLSLEAIAAVPERMGAVRFALASVMPDAEPAAAT
ncbi:MAG TPA: o-succinylbenzoate synthase, partial [Acidobacteriota bacterium]|nr:o-succinylbenzoate synthase [Acidobacteriota bacterium]